MNMLKPPATPKKKVKRSSHNNRAREVAPATCLARPIDSIPDDADKDLLRFLYDKRLSLLNTRREHEWKIYFASFAVLGAMDAALLTDKIVLSSDVFLWEVMTRLFWAVACYVLFHCCRGYERDLQLRNKDDRKAMNLFYNALCDQAGITNETHNVREKADDFRTYSYGWAHHWQMWFLLLAVVVSAILPWFHHVALAPNVPVQELLVGGME